MSTRFAPVFAWFLALAIVQNVAGQPPASTDAMWGTPNTYEILERPNSKHASLKEVTSQTQLTSRPVKPYAYGWFGTKPTPHWQRQFGYSRTYTQWTLK